MQKPTLIIGGGISGVTAAVEIAEVGREVILVEKEAYLGGNVIQFNNYFPKLCPPACGLEINFRRIRQNPGIKTLTSTNVKKIEGKKGNFKVTISISPQYVKNNCTACGKCVEVCPEERPNAFNYNFDKTKAIYSPHEMAFPNKYSIDDAYCKKETCNKCVEVCEYNAIDLAAKKELSEIEVGSIIVATGWENYDATNIDNLNYESLDDVVTNVEFERILAPNGPTKGEILKPSDQQTAKEFAFVQCAGSRDENYLPYCSAVCCSASLKHALNIQEKYPESKVKIFYIDLRVSGRNEDFLNRVKENKNIELIKGKVAKIEKGNGKIIVEAEDILQGKKNKYEVDMAILATGIVPQDLELTITNQEKEYGNIIQVEGISIAGCAKKPMDVSASVKDATGMALKAIQN